MEQEFFKSVNHQIMERVVEFFQLKTINLHQLENGQPTFNCTADAVRWYIKMGYIKPNDHDIPTLYGFP